MSITKESELVGMKQISDIVAYTLREMRNYVQPGMSTKQLDDYGASILKDFNANSAPFMTYKFPGWTCISVSNEILRKAITNIKGGIKISDIGHLIETEAKKRGYKVIKNLGGHGIGRSLHEQPDELLNYKNRYDQRRFKKNSVVAIETFIATASNYAIEQNDGWTMVGDKGGYMAQHEHTIVVTDNTPIILTEKNEIWN